MLIDREAALVIKTITNTAIEISEKEEKIDMCKAIDDMLSEREARGAAKGEIRGIFGIDQGSFFIPLALYG